MRKLLVSAVLASSILSNNALAEGMYAKGVLGLNTIVKTSKHKANGLYTIKLKDNFPVIGGGIGYEFDNGFRIEGMFDYYFLFTQKEKSKDLDGTSYSLNLKTKISDIMLNSYKSFPVNEYMTVFAGGGIGVAYLKDRAKGYALEKDEYDNLFYHRLPATKGKQVYNLAYKASIGADLKLSDNTKGEISYNYFNFGKNKPRVAEGSENITKRNFSVHNVSLGIRVSL